jgi:TonB-linked outer membrane protein, SusC/RagA family
MKKRENEKGFRPINYLKVFKLLKLTLLLIVLTCLQVSAKTYSQNKITLRLESVEIKKAMQIIERKSDYHFLYNEAVIANTPKVTLNVTDADITTVLDKIFVANNISYRILNNNLVVLKNNKDTKTIIQDIRISGHVTGNNGEPLAGVSVTIKGSNIGTTTDAAGNFSISVPDQNTILVFSYVGFTTQEVVVGNRTAVNLALTGTASQLDQVVVVGYGTQRKVDVTGSVGQVRGEEISKQPAPNPISSLQGKVAGVQITNNGQPGASPEIKIRGLGTFYGNPNPLYVVDGVWYTDIGFLNPADIENISILKDASSEAIYGVRAANGVVLITTRKGRAGQSIVNYNGYVGMQHVTNDVKMANANQYATLINELSAINGGGQVLDPTKFGEGTDWYHQILRNAIVTNHQVSMIGGTDRSNYNFSLGYFRQEGIVKTNDYTRYTARLQNDITLFKPLKIGYSVTAAASNSHDIPGSIFHQLYAAAPVVPVYYADGSYGDPSDFNLGDANNFNPQVTLDYYNQQSKIYRLTGSVYADLKFASHFTFHSSAGGEFAENEVKSYTPEYAATLKQRNTTSILSLIKRDDRNWIVENTLTYDNRFGDHNVRVLVGQTAQRIQYYQFTGTAQNVPNTTPGDQYFRLANTTGRNIVDEGDLATSSSYFGRINYSFRSRYLLNASIRADGSSKFFGSDRWGYFPSIGAGWVISDEGFMSSQHIFNTLKLRGSWGKIGNASIPSNLAIATTSVFPPAIFGPGTGTAYTAASVSTLVPPTLIWEHGDGTDVGIESSIIHNKLYLEADYYIKKTVNSIFDVNILSSLGTTNNNIIGNQATFVNKGYEFTAIWKNAINKDIFYTISANFSINNNEVQSVTTGNNPIYRGGNAATGGALATRTVVGVPIGAFYGYQVIGIFQNQQQIATSAQPNAKPGDFIYADLSGTNGKPDGKIDGLDRIVMGNPNPKYTYGLNTNWTFKQFDLTLDFQGVAKVDIYNANIGIRYGNENFSQDFYNNRWHGAGTSNTYPSANIGGGTNYLPNTFFVESGSYFRIRNLQLGYNLSNLFNRGNIIKSFRVYVNAQNAFNFFKYKGFSPEIGGGPGYAGIDTNVYPLYATYNFGVNLTF